MTNLEKYLPAILTSLQPCSMAHLRLFKDSGEDIFTCPFNYKCNDCRADSIKWLKSEYIPEENDNDENGL